MGNVVRSITGQDEPLQVQRDRLRQCQKRVEIVMATESSAAESSLAGLQRRKYQEHQLRQADALVARLDAKAREAGRALRERGGGGGATGGNAVDELGKELLRGEEMLSGPAPGPDGPPMSMRRKAAIGAWAAWMLVSFGMPREFGVPWFIVGALIGICTLGLGSRESGTMSAYSVFNPNVERLEGAMTAESFALPGQPRYDAADAPAGPPVGGGPPMGGGQALGRGPPAALAAPGNREDFCTPSGITLADYEDAYEDGDGPGQAGGLRARGKDRNAACPCGSGRKAKKCCG